MQRENARVQNTSSVLCPLAFWGLETFSFDTQIEYAKPSSSRLVGSQS
jgi:hypothetical protein